ncbi:hypothetical protein BE08_19655 [Sorangium cellulosum]|uniref:Uncharacterized protein n=1 Tax=Sorangium cellulosum TaxID=56 RepID=A0A150P1N2_SORCE|nr:hypothetical protein BE08_19655 [Sorangium cellulosum]
MTIASEMSAAARCAERGFRPGPRASGALGQLFTDALSASLKGLFTDALSASLKGLRGDRRRR